MRAPPRAYLLRAPPTELYALLQSAALGASAAPSQRASQLRCPSRAFASPAAATCAADAARQTPICRLELHSLAGSLPKKRRNHRELIPKRRLQSVALGSCTAHAGQVSVTTPFKPLALPAGRPAQGQKPGSCRRRAAAPPARRPSARPLPPPLCRRLLRRCGPARWRYGIRILTRIYSGPCVGVGAARRAGRNPRSTHLDLH